MASSGEENSRSRSPRSRRRRWIATTAALGVSLLTVTFTLAWPQDVYENLGLFTEVLTDNLATSRSRERDPTGRC